LHDPTTVPGSPASSPPSAGPRAGGVMPAPLRWGLGLTCLAVAGLTGWYALPRIGDRPLDPDLIRWSAPGLALAAGLLAIVGHRATRQTPADRWWVAAAVVVLLAGAAAAAGFLEAIRAPLERGIP
jgi:hypothetical protein